MFEFLKVYSSLDPGHSPLPLDKKHTSPTPECIHHKSNPLSLSPLSPSVFTSNPEGHEKNTIWYKYFTHHTLDTINCLSNCGSKISGLLQVSGVSVILNFNLHTHDILYFLLIAEETINLFIFILSFLLLFLLLLNIS